MDDSERLTGRYPSDISHHRGAKNLIKPCYVLLAIGDENSLGAGVIFCGEHYSNMNNTITDGGVALPPLLLTIVITFSNLRSLSISRNSRDSREG